MHPATSLAIDKFQEILRVERLLDLKKQEQSALMARVPAEDMEEYVLLTENSRKQDAQIRERNHLPAGS